MQTYSQWECIIINDGSTDDTKFFLDSLTDERFRICHFEKNKGRPYARQNGLELAQGEYIAMLDADDIYHPEKLAIQVKIMEQYPEVVLVSAGMCSFGTHVDFVRIRNKGDGNIHLYKGRDSLPIPHAPSMLRRERAIQFFYDLSLELGEDTDYLKKYLMNEYYILLPQVLYYYSEYDSVNKNKILRGYKLGAKSYFKTKNYTDGVKSIVKLVFCYFIFPVIDVNHVLKKRGQAPTVNEIKEFEDYCVSIIKRVKK
jgi:glycosyltransferase involved in cell wall biosynthesis